MKNKETIHPIQKAALIYGSQAALARELGISKGALNQWMLPGREVPVIHCVAIERLSKGEVTRKKLRPNDWRDIWPELSSANAKSQHSGHPHPATNSTPAE